MPDFDEPITSRIRKAQEAYQRKEVHKGTSPELLEQISGWIWTKASLNLLEHFQETVKFLEAQALRGGLALKASLQALPEDLKGHLEELMMKFGTEMFSEPSKKMVEHNLKQLHTIAKRAKSFSPELESIEKNLQTYVDEGMPSDPESIHKMSENIGKAVQNIAKLFQEKRVPPDEANSLLDEFSAIFKENIDICDRYNLTFDKKIQSFEDQNRTIDDASSEVDHLTEFFERISLGKAPSSENVEEFFKSLAQFTSLYRTLPEDIQDRAKPLLDTLQQTTFKDKPFSTIVGEGTLSTWLKNYLQKYPDAKASDFTKWADNELETLRLVSPNHPFFGNLLKSFQSHLSNPNFPKNLTAFNEPMGSEVRGQLQSNPELAKALQTTFLLSPEELEQVVAALSSTQDGLTLRKEENKAKIEGTLRAQSKLGELKDTSKLGDADVNVKTTLQDTLPQDLVDMLLKFWMPQEMGQLKNLADLLKAYNDATGFFNNVLDSLSDLSQIGSVFAIASYLFSIGKGGPPPLFPMSKLVQFANLVKDGQDLCDKLLGKPPEYTGGSLDKAIGQIKDFLAKIDMQQPPSPIAKELHGILDPLITNLQQIKPMLQQLSFLLNHIHVEPQTDPKDTFKIIDDTVQPPIPLDISKLSNLEKMVINGDGTVSGLSKIFSGMSSKVGYYSGLGQVQQTMLSLTMTRVNQEWTLVASVLQTLYEVGMSPARGIRGG